MAKPHRGKRGRCVAIAKLAGVGDLLGALGACSAAPVPTEVPERLLRLAREVSERFDRGPSTGSLSPELIAWARTVPEIVDVQVGNRDTWADRLLRDFLSLRMDPA